MSKPVSAHRVTIKDSDSGARHTVITALLTNGRTLDVEVSFNASREDMLQSFANALVDQNHPARFERLSSGLVELLVAIRRAVGEKDANSVHLQRDVNFSKTEYNNAQKLRYHGLIAHDLDARAGYWLITRRGARFLSGDLHVPQVVTVKGNTVIDHSDVVVDITDVTTRSTPRFDDKFAFIPHPSELEYSQVSLL